MGLNDVNEQLSSVSIAYAVIKRALSRSQKPPICHSQFQSSDGWSCKEIRGDHKQRLHREQATALTPGTCRAVRDPGRTGEVCKYQGRAAQTIVASAPPLAQRLGGRGHHTVPSQRGGGWQGETSSRPQEQASEGLQKHRPWQPRSSLQLASTPLVLCEV